MYDRLFSDLRGLHHVYSETARSMIQSWIHRHTSRLEFVKHDFVDDEVPRLILTLRLPIEFQTREGFLTWRNGVDWATTTTGWGLRELLAAADTYEVVLEEGEEKPCLILLHFHDPLAIREAP